MKNYFIKIAKNFSTSFFYEKLLKEMHICLKEDINNKVVFDMSETTFIDALVIPNLLCVGSILKETTGHMPIITTINTQVYSTKADTAQFLYEIGFIELAQRLNLFEIHCFGSDGKRPIIREYSTTYYFDLSYKAKTATETKRRIARRISDKSRELFEEHLKDYFDTDSEIGYCNKFARIAAELCSNSLIHSNIPSFMTIQSNLFNQTVSIAVSDRGCGFYDSLYSKLIDEEIKVSEGRQLDKTIQFYTINKNSFKELTDKRSLHAIVESTFFRYYEGKVYGISDIASTVLKEGGLIRIHSTDSRIKLTQSNFPFIFQMCEDPERLRNMLIKEFIKKKDYNFKSGLKFMGVHYEIEMPIKTSSRSGTNVYY